MKSFMVPVTRYQSSADYNFPFHVSALADAVNSSFVSTASTGRCLLDRNVANRDRPRYLHRRSRPAGVSIQTIEDIATARYRKHKIPVLITFMHLLYRTRLISGRRRTTAEPGDSDKQAYLDQIEYASTQITKLATNLRAMDPTAIIIIEADEGMAYPDPQDSALNRAEDNTEWNGTLSAWYVPFNTQGITITQILGDAAKYVESLNK